MAPSGNQAETENTKLNLSFGKNMLDSPDDWPYPYTRIGDLYIKAGLPRFFRGGILTQLGTGLHDADRFHMAIRAYFDGSGKSACDSDLAVTLGGIGMREEEIPEFEVAWKESVIDIDQIKSLHMTDLMAGQGEFKNWSEDRKRRLLKNALNVLGRFAHRSLHGSVCTVMKKDWQTVRSEYKNVYSIGSICVNFCVSNLRLDEDLKLYLYFDRKEEFMHKINRVWERNRNRKTGWPRQIQNILPADAESNPLLQAADMLAWPVRQKYVSPSQPQVESLNLGILLTTQYREAMYDEKALRENVEQGKFLSSEYHYELTQRSKKRD